MCHSFNINIWKNWIDCYDFDLIMLLFDIVIRIMMRHKKQNGMNNVHDRHSCTYENDTETICYGYDKNSSIIMLNVYPLLIWISALWSKWAAHNCLK